MPTIFHNSWDDLLADELAKPYYLTLRAELAQRYATRTVYPPKQLVYNALRLTPPENIKCVIVGQDPYHGPGQAMGLSFSVPRGVEPPPSLKNIFKELHDDTGLPLPSGGDLTPWAEQGVLLLNALLTVERGAPLSHDCLGWARVTDAVLQVVNGLPQPIVFLLWGNPAQRKAAFLNNANHLVLKAPHPSPLSAHRGFFASQPFSQTNAFLTAHNVKPIDWTLS